MSIRQQVQALWAANLAFTLALFVPVVDLYVCDIIGFLILIRLHRGLSSDSPESFRPVRWLAFVCLACAIAISILSSARRINETSLSLLLLPVSLVYFGISLLLYWQYMGGAAELAARLGADELATHMHNSRGIYIFFSIGLLFLMSGLYQSTFPDADPNDLRTALLADLMVMPAVWCLNWFFLLRPMTWLRRALPADETA
jgi:hypothetical protein